MTNATIDTAMHLLLNLWNMLKKVQEILGKASMKLKIICGL